MHGEQRLWRTRRAVASRWSGRLASARESPYESLEKGAITTESYARRLFGTAAFFNFLVAFGVLFLRPLLPAVRFDPLTGTNLLFFYFAVILVGTFGYAYLRIAQDPKRYRPFIELGVIGKLLAVASTTWCWLAGEVGWQLPLAASGDLVFALLFIDYLRRTPSA